MRKILLAIFLLLPFHPFSQSLVLNEIAQGAGNSEYVEFVVVGTPSCTQMVCANLIGIIIDDNNGNFASGSGTGIASGVMRFADTSFWSCVPIGTILVVYNAASRNSSIPPDDILLDDGNCTLIIPSNSLLFDHHATIPNLSVSTYPTTGWVSGGDWNTCAMANAGDSYQILENGTLTSAVSWGNNLINPMIYMPIVGAGVVYYNDNDDPLLQANWQIGPNSSYETPGVANSVNNNVWISYLNHQCGAAFLNSSISTSNSSCDSLCNGIAQVNVTGGVPGYSYQWSTGDTTANISGLCTGNYTVTIEDSTNCQIITPVTITNPAPLAYTINTTSGNCNQQNGSICVNISGGNAPYNYAWNDANLQTSACAVNLNAGVYAVTVSDVNQCQIQATGTLSSVGIGELTIQETLNICNQHILSINSKDLSSIIWSNGSSNDTITAENSGNYWVKAKDINACDVGDSIFVSKTIIPTEDPIFPNVFSPNSDNFNENFEFNLSNAMQAESLKIFNRWGKMVYESTDIYPLWNGKNKSNNEVTSGVYYWILEYKNACIPNSEKMVNTGYLTLVR